LTVVLSDLKNFSGTVITTNNLNLLARIVGLLALLSLNEWASWIFD